MVSWTTYGARFWTACISMNICLVMGIEEARARMRQQTFSNERKMRFHFRHGAYRKPAVKVGCRWSELECTSTSQNMKTWISSHFVLSFFCYPHPIAYQTCFFYTVLCIFLRNTFCSGKGGGDYLWPFPSPEQKTNDWRMFLSFSCCPNYLVATIHRGAQLCAPWSLKRST